MSSPSSADGGSLPQPRLCHIRKTFPEQEYGFNLHGEKGKKGQYIGSVDADSPADLASLRAGDRILEVNGFSVANEDHKRVVAKIREDPMQCNLLVVEDRTISVHKSNLKHSASPRISNGNVHTQATSSSLSNARLHNQNASQSVTRLKPKLCRLYRTSTIEEFGFNLLAEVGHGYFVGKVDGSSIAEHAGLEEGQRIVGVNKSLVYPTTAHKDVVVLIKQNPICILFLVASPEVDEYYARNSLIYNFDEADSFGEHEEGETSDSGVSSNGVPTIVRKSDKEHFSPDGIVRLQESINKLSLVTDGVSNGSTANGHAKSNGHFAYSNDNRVAVDVSNIEENKQTTKTFGGTTTTTDVTHTAYEVPSMSLAPQSNKNMSSLPSTGENDLLKMSAAQMRERVSKNKKIDVRNEPNLSFKQKYEIVRNL